MVQLLENMKKYYVFLAILVGCLTMASCSKSSDSSKSEKNKKEKKDPDKKKSGKDLSDVEDLFSSDESELQGKFLCSKDNDCVVYFKKKQNKGNYKFEINAIVDGKFEEIARGEYSLSKDKEDESCVELDGHDGPGKMTADRLEIKVDGETYVFKDFRIITEDEADEIVKSWSEMRKDADVRVDTTMVRRTADQMEVNQTATLAGKIDDKYAINMTLHCNGRIVTGTYYYVKNGPAATLNLKGTIDEVGNLDIHETNDDGQPTGHFEGTYGKSQGFQGVFVNFKGDKMYFDLNVLGVRDHAGDGDGRGFLIY